MLSKFAEVKVAKVDCTVEVELCNDNLVRSYPSIRLYPLDYEGTSKYLMYTGFHRDAFTLREWVLEHLPDVVETLTPYTFQQNVLAGNQPYLIDFYAPCKIGLMQCIQTPKAVNIITWPHMFDTSIR